MCKVDIGRKTFDLLVLNWKSQSFIEEYLQCPRYLGRRIPAQSGEESLSTSAHATQHEVAAKLNSIMHNYRHKQSNWQAEARGVWNMHALPDAIPPAPAPAPASVPVPVPAPARVPALPAPI